MNEHDSEPSKLHWPSVLQVVLTAIAVLISFGAAALGFVGGVIEWFSPSADIYGVSTYFSLSLGALIVGGSLLAPIYFGVMRLSGRTVELGARWRRVRKWFHPKRMLIVFPFVLLYGYLSDQTDLSRNLVLPIFNILSLSIPVVVLVWLALRGLPKGSYQLGWGSFSLGLAIGPSVVLLLEILAFLLIVVVLVFSTGSNAELTELFTGFSTLAFEGDDPYLVEQMLGELFNSPGALVAILVFLSGFVPIIEELLKPIGVWVLLGRKLRPVDGWVIGALSGAGFGLFENLGNAPISSGWVLAVVSRAAATVPHVFTAGLMGYTLALARTQKRYGRVLLSFLLVVTIHAAWNAAYVFHTTAILAPPDGLLSPDWAPIFLVAVGVLAGGMIIAMLRINRKLKFDPDGTQPAAVLTDDLPEGNLEQNN